MIEQRLFHVKHLETMVPIDPVDAVMEQEVSESPYAWTVLSDNIPVCIWGKCPVWNGRSILWCLMGEGSRTCMKQIIELTGAVIVKMEEARIEATTRVGFKAGSRFLEHLGFQRECIMRKFSPYGDDEYLYARVS